MHHHRPVRRTLAVAALLGAALVAAAVAAGERGFQTVDKKWIKGPASYLATAAEAKAFKKQGDQQEREAFVEKFWSLRDPTPDTEANEFRDRFYARVADADETIKEKGIPAGWKSDPGRVLILLGPPTDLRTEEGDRESVSSDASAAPSRFGESTFSGDSTATQSQTPSGGGQLVLIYSDLTHLGLPSELEVEFRRDGLSYSLLTRLDLTGDAIRGLDREVLVAEFPPGEEAVEEKISLEEPAADTDSLAGGMGSVQTEVLMDILEGTEPEAAAVPFVAVVDYYKALGNMTYVAFTVGLPMDDLESQGLSLDDLHPVAALQDTSDPENLFLYDSDKLFAPSDADLQPADDGYLRFQAGDGVRPGEYRLVVGVVNSDGSLTGLHADTVEVPDFSSGIQISSITLAQTWEETDAGGTDLKRPYILGSRRVVPRVDSNYESGGNLVLYYQVYNAETDGGAPNLRISYNFYQKRGSRYVRRGTAPPQDGVQDQVQIYELSLAGWPKGEYKLKVTVTDNLTGDFAEREVPFQVG